MARTPARNNPNSDRGNGHPLNRLAPTGETLPDESRAGESLPPDRAGSAEFRVRSKVWIEDASGRVLISEFRAQLLEALERHGSVAAAARALGLPNRTAWKKLDEMEAAAAVPLVTSAPGGADGGRTSLTDAARELLKAYQRMSGSVSPTVQAQFEQARAGLPLARGEPVIRAPRASSPGQEA